MIIALHLLALALGISFGFLAPIFFASVAAWNASIGYPELKRFLPKIFKIAFWFFLVVSVANIVALLFLDEDRSGISIFVITSGTLAWRFWRATKKSSTREPSIAEQPPGLPFPWPQATPLTALEELTIGLPTELLTKSEIIGSVICCDPDAQIHIPTKPGESMILLRLKAGMSATLTRPCQAVIIADDKRPRRIKVGLLPK